MGWDQRRAETRIRKHLTTAPEIAQGATLAKSVRLVELAASASDQFPRGKAVFVEGVHLYGQMLDFDDIVAQNKRETEQSHTRVLQFLDLHYRVWDSILEDDDVVRVDYHGPRLHAVITRPENNPAEQLTKAIALAGKLEKAARVVGDAHGFPAHIRFGIDHGQCLGMSTGRKYEKDILFLGRPANHAAKLAAATNEPGIFLTDYAKALLSSAAPVMMGKRVLAETVDKAVQTYRFDRVDAAAAHIAKQNVTPVNFVFHRTGLPLSNLNFEELSPSNSVRMEMACLFADIVGFTAYVDNAIREGERAVRDVVQAIHVLREELNSVLKDDFGGKRVRFIGDCIQGVLAENDANESVREAALCASGMRDSFSLTQVILKTIDKLDLAVGVEWGQVPLTRIGNRGADSVRCAAGLAVVRSEQMQQSIEGGGIRLGENALGHADHGMKAYFQKAAPLMAYADAADHFGSHASPVVQIMHKDSTARPHAAAPTMNVFRALGGKQE